jgi:hypothetical protein
MCIRVGYILSDLCGRLGDAIEEVSSLKDRIFSVAFDCFNPVFTASSRDDRSFSRWATSTWANIKNQGIYCWTLAYSCIQRVARAFERFVHPELVPEERQPQRSAALSADANALVDQGNFGGDRRSVLAAVRENGNALQYASCWLKWDRELVLAAVRQNGNALQYASFWLRSDREVVREAVGQNGNALQYASRWLRSDREVVFAAVRQNGNALQYADDRLRADREVIFAAVRQNGNALGYADNYFFSGDREVVLAAVRQNGNALRYAHRRLQGDKEFVLAAVRQTHEALQYADLGLQRDQEVLAARGAYLHIASNHDLQ